MRLLRGGPGLSAGWTVWRGVFLLGCGPSDPPIQLPVRAYSETMASVLEERSRP